MAAARTLADLVTEADLAQGSLYPPLSRVREVSAHIAAAVAAIAFAREARRRAAAARPARLRRSRMYEPRYAELCRDHDRSQAAG